MKSSTKIAVFLLLSVLVVVGLLLIVFSCALYNVWSPLFIFPALLVTGLPVAAASALSSPTSFTDPSLNRSTLEFCYFLTGTLLTSVYALPLLFWHIAWIEQGSVWYATGGATVILAAAVVYQAVFNKVDEDAF